ncbi:MAG: hypothetical protein J4F31_02395 [Flavobacteriales bacterium]|nr:hypothetical protein [Flavobacteriales bacterium]
MEKVGKILSYVFMVGAAIFFVMALVNGNDAIDNDASIQAAVIDPFMYIAYFAAGLASLLTVIFAVYFLITHPEKAKNSLIGIGALVVVFGIGYVLASGNVTEAMTKVGGVTETTSKRVGMGLITFYLLVGIAVLAVVISSFKTIVRR